MGGRAPAGERPERAGQRAFRSEFECAGSARCGSSSRAINGRSRRIADVADRGLGRVNWADSGRWPNGGNRADSRRPKSRQERLGDARSTHSPESQQTSRRADSRRTGIAKERSRVALSIAPLSPTEAQSSMPFSWTAAMRPTGKRAGQRRHVPPPLRPALKTSGPKSPLLAYRVDFRGHLPLGILVGGGREGGLSPGASAAATSPAKICLPQSTLFVLRAGATLWGPPMRFLQSNERSLLICGNLFSYRVLRSEFTKTTFKFERYSNAMFAPAFNGMLVEFASAVEAAPIAAG